MARKKKELSGVLAPMVTPFKEDKIVWQGLVDNVEKMNGTGLAGYFVLGTNGEYKSLSVEERFEVLRAVVKHRTNGKTVMAGMGFESTRETIDMTLRAADEGADMVSLLMPHFFAKKMTPEALAGAVQQPFGCSRRHHKGRTDQSREGSSEPHRHQGQLRRDIQGKPGGCKGEDIGPGRFRRLFS
jgi:hypothetical protein